MLVEQKHCFLFIKYQCLYQCQLMRIKNDSHLFINKKKKLITKKEYVTMIILSFS